MTADRLNRRVLLGNATAALGAAAFGVSALQNLAAGLSFD